VFHDPWGVTPVDVAFFGGRKLLKFKYLANFAIVKRSHP